MNEQILQLKIFLIVLRIEKKIKWFAAQTNTTARPSIKIMEASECKSKFTEFCFYTSIDFWVYGDLIVIFVLFMADFCDQIRRRLL